MSLPTSFQLKGWLRELLLFCFSKKVHDMRAFRESSAQSFIVMEQEIITPSLNSETVFAGFYLTRLFVLSSCGLVYRTICGFVHCVMRGNNSWSPPGGARHTADGQPGSSIDTSRQREELKASPTMWQLEYILTVQWKPCGTLIVQYVLLGDVHSINNGCMCKMCGKSLCFNFYITEKKYY